MEDRPTSRLYLEVPWVGSGKRSQKFVRGDLIRNNILILIEVFVGHCHHLQHRKLAPNCPHLRWKWKPSQRATSRCPFSSYPPSLHHTHTHVTFSQAAQPLVLPGTNTFAKELVAWQLSDFNKMEASTNRLEAIACRFLTSTKCYTFKFFISM